MYREQRIERRSRHAVMIYLKLKMGIKFIMAFHLLD